MTRYQSGHGRAARARGRPQGSPLHRIVIASAATPWVTTEIAPTSGNVGGPYRPGQLPASLALHARYPAYERQRNKTRGDAENVGDVGYDIGGDQLGNGLGTQAQSKRCLTEDAA